jgi:hypothetical protein
LAESKARAANFRTASAKKKAGTVSLGAPKGIHFTEAAARFPGLIVEKISLFRQEERLSSR